MAGASFSIPLVRKAKPGKRLEGWRAKNTRRWHHAASPLAALLCSLPHDSLFDDPRFDIPEVDQPNQNENERSCTIQLQGL